MDTNNIRCAEAEHKQVDGHKQLKVYIQTGQRQLTVSTSAGHTKN